MRELNKGCLMLKWTATFHQHLWWLIAYLCLNTLLCWPPLFPSAALSSAVAMLMWRSAAMRAGPWCSWTSSSSSWSWRSWPTCDPSPIKSLLRPTSRPITWRRMTWSSLSRITGWDGCKAEFKQLICFPSKMWTSAFRWKLHAERRHVCFADSFLFFFLCRSTPWSS